MWRSIYDFLVAPVPVWFPLGTVIIIIIVLIAIVCSIKVSETDDPPHP